MVQLREEEGEEAAAAAAIVLTTCPRSRWRSRVVNAVHRFVPWKTFFDGSSSSSCMHCIGLRWQHQLERAIEKNQRACMRPVSDIKSCRKDYHGAEEEQILDQQLYKGAMMLHKPNEQLQAVYY